MAARQWRQQSQIGNSSTVAAKGRQGNSSSTATAGRCLRRQRSGSGGRAAAAVSGSARTVAVAAVVEATAQQQRWWLQRQLGGRKQHGRQGGRTAAAAGQRHHNSLVGFIGLGFISLVGYIGLVGCNGHNGLVSISGLFKLKTHGVAIKLTSATKNTNVAIWYYCAAYWYCAHSFVRESWLSHMFSRLDSLFFGNALQNAKQLFSLGLPQMKKYCIMRECENIQSWTSLSGDLAFSHQQGI